MDYHLFHAKMHLVNTYYIHNDSGRQGIVLSGFVSPHKYVTEVFIILLQNAMCFNRNQNFVVD